MASTTRAVELPIPNQKISHIQDCDLCCAPINGDANNVRSNRRDKTGTLGTA